MNHKLFLAFSCTIATLGGLMFGIDIGIISGAIPYIQPYFGWDELELGWGVSSILVGCVVGSAMSGYFSERYGRKNSLLVIALFFAISCVGMALAHTSIVFIMYRLIGGLALGAVSVISPIYVAEITPPKVRGKFVSLYQLSIVFGILVAYLINYGLHDVDNNWRWMFGVGVFPSIIFFIGVFFIPESPRWLIRKGYKEKAKSVLKSLEGDFSQIEFDNISISANKGNSSKLSELFGSKYRKLLWVGFFLAMFVQMCGINTVVDYAPKILLSTGIEIKSALLQTSLIGLINFSFTFVSILLIDKVGRRPLYIIGSLGMGITLLALAISFFFSMSGWITLICIFLFIASFSSCIGPVFWTLISEIFPNKIRSIGVAFGSFIQWIFNFIVILFFPFVFDALEGGVTFLILAIMSFLQLMFTIKYVKETAGRSLEELENLYAN